VSAPASDSLRPPTLSFGRVTRIGLSEQAWVIREGNPFTGRLRRM
jgi:hypothetical protein